jgi:hypothetical protein
MVGIGDRVGKCVMIEHKAASTVLARAAEKLGGRKALAERLGVRDDDLSQYIDGNLPVSEDLYLKAVDIVLGDRQDPKH